MLTVGELLQRERLKKNLTLEAVEKATKIRLKFLDALERNEFNRLPPGTFAKGFIKNYAAFLGLSVEETIAFYRRQVSEEKAKVMPESRSNPQRQAVRITPQIFTVAGVAILLVLFFAYLIFSYFKFAGAPMLSVDRPSNNSVVTKDQIEVAGKSDPDATLSINDEPVQINQEGKFDIKVPLSPGLNTLTVVATNKFKKQSTVVRNVRLEQ